MKMKSVCTKRELANRRRPTHERRAAAQRSDKIERIWVTVPRAAVV
jgi:hypothetical protein